MSGGEAGAAGVRDVRDHQVRVVPFAAGDGMALNLVNVRGDNAPERGPVLLVHGAGVRADLFRSPANPNVVDALVAAGYDVWRARKVAD